MFKFKRVGLRLKEDRLHEIRSGSLHGRSIVALGFGFAVTAQMLKGRSCGGRLHTAKSIVRVAGEGGTDGTLMRGSSTSIIFAKLKHETRHVLRRSSLACFKNDPMIVEAQYGRAPAAGTGNLGHWRYFADISGFARLRPS